MHGYKRGGGIPGLPYKECPILFLQQDIEDQIVHQEQFILWLHPQYQTNLC